ncbi:unnamed protein product [Rotaria sp. Silwood1]|nr:unnamed protein product [Rotaria sp. Silwood1]CAF1657568.1 unnamed protein product [Rotaria sp. Silwood1]
MSIISILFICIILFLVVYLLYNHCCYFSNRSIPSPPIHSIIFGHLYDLWSAKSYSEQLRQWTRQYGSVYGLFEGTRPHYVISDIKVMEEIFITQFARFYARRTTLANRIVGKEHFNVFSANIAQLWKKQRKILNPTFSGAKMRRLLPTVEACVNVFMKRLALIPNGTIINIYELYKRLTMDTICQCAFSIDTEVQYDLDNNNIYMKKVEELFRHDFERTRLGRIHRATSNTLLANEQLLPTELLSNVFIILIAGFETTSTALAYCTYRLAIHPDIQQKLYEELLEHCSSDSNSYDVVMSKLTYMDMFVREVLRMHPIAVQAINRECMEDTDVAGYHIQKGSSIQVDVLSVHYNQELWGPEPVDEFHPERHSCKRHPLAYMPFGGGPRICIGMRFALMEMKSCLARLMSTYRILPSSQEKYKLNICEEIVIAPAQVFIKLEKR